jgi:hypothetical protein
MITRESGNSDKRERGQIRFCIYGNAEAQEVWCGVRATVGSQRGGRRRGLRC